MCLVASAVSPAAAARSAPGRGPAARPASPPSSRTGAAPRRAPASSASLRSGSNGSSSWTAAASSRFVTATPIRVRPLRSIIGVAAASSARARGEDRLGLGRRRGASCATGSPARSRRSAGAGPRSGPTRPAARIRRVTRSTSADQAGVDLGGRARPAAERPLRRRSSAGGGARARPRVAVVGEGVQVRGRRPAEQRRPAPPRRAAATWPTVAMPAVAQLAGGHRADAPEPLDRQRVQERELPVGRRPRSRPSGLATPLATLARNFVRATPTVIGRPTRSRTSPPQPGGDLDRRAGEPLAARGRRGRPRRSRAPRPAASCPRTPRTRPCWPRSRPTSGARRRSRRGTAGGPAGRPSPCGRRAPSPRSSPRARRRRRR